ncbi:acetyl-CoA synthetase-like protein [Aspergillus sclerotioniger CBS 115572]|uniref:Acetyl-CoA synthetase-like protein n=1 Tax=Aspergillus sclerotioniger CBS 115572 TaxID=1450535 RepID=A0A317WH93_9EURO|nr:acetyl-CoA synthetase-like protein [Aspergillus sclerotioniger CBS 115572]PWY85856.1 acetyl-CoA synthetase-like protein [Aspergillus sclerotioniger CBS 115572]
MVFLPAKWAGTLPAIPDNIPLSEFMLTDLHGRNPLGYSRDPFTCGITGRSFSALEVVDRVDYLSRALAKELNWRPNTGTEWDKTLAIFSLNTIDTLPLSWAVHQLGGVVSPANASYSAAELKHQLLDSKAKALFTCLPLLKTALEAASLAGLPKDRIYLLEVPPQLTPGIKAPAQYKTVSQFIEEGKALPKLERLNWSAGEGARRTAFLCYSSGTSGLPKGVMISHRNVIANVLQIGEFEATYRESLKAPGSQSDHTEVSLCLLPQSHIYCLVVICHSSPFRGDQAVVLPKFDLNSYLASIQNFKISALFLVPPIIINMLRNQETCSKYDLSSITSLFTGAAPLGVETAADFQKLYPNVIVRQGYGLTETSTVVCSTHPSDIFLGSSGCLLAGVEMRLVTPEGKEITSYDTPGELVVRSPSVVLGYLNNEKANKETFEDGWMRTGDEAVIRLSPKNTEHVFIVDRIKELIKVKGLQVAPAELEAHLLTHPAVADCAVIAIPDEAAGEIPKAIVVKSSSASGSDEEIIESIKKHVSDHKARHKWLKGGVRFIDVVPKSPSGKILRRLLRDQEKEARRQAGSKL